jgi:hypothetical protein
LASVVSAASASRSAITRADVGFIGANVPSLRVTRSG